MMTDLLVLARRLPAGTKAPDPAVGAAVTLDFDQRQKTRQRLTLDDGRPAALMLDRGQTLQAGDRLTDAAGSCVVVVRAAPERLSVVRCQDRALLNRVCYHLGNRHVPLDVGIDTVRYRHDHVLDAMVRGLGATPEGAEGPFNPEPGAYEGGHAHAHAHGHD